MNIGTYQLKNYIYSLRTVNLQNFTPVGVLMIIAIGISEEMPVKDCISGLQSDMLMP